MTNPRFKDNRIEAPQVPVQPFEFKERDYYYAMLKTKGVMTFAEFDALFNETVEEIRKLLGVKGGEYTGATDDRLAAFKRSGDLAGAAPLQCLLIYMAKHYDAFATYVRDDAACKTRERSEPIEGRLNDIINYCILAKAIIRANGG